MPAPTPKLKTWLKRSLGRRNLERARILRRAVSELMQTLKGPDREYPIPIREIEETLRDWDVRKGDVLFIQSSLTHLFSGSSKPTAEAALSELEYGKRVIQLILDSVGSEGTVLMNTDSLARDKIGRIWSGETGNGLVFDYRRSPSIRGMISEIFRRRRDVIRSVHPWYNVTGWGKLAEHLVQDHHKSTPYTMDRHSPWYKLNEVGGKVLLLGRAFQNANSLLVLAEYLHPEEFPRGIYLNKPVRMRYVDREGATQTINVMLHAGRRHEGDTFCDYLNNKYRIYRIRDFSHRARIVNYLAADQYAAVYQEMKNNITWYDSRFWPENMGKPMEG